MKLAPDFSQPLVRYRRDNGKISQVSERDGWLYGERRADLTVAKHRTGRQRHGNSERGGGLEKLAAVHGLLAQLAEFFVGNGAARNPRLFDVAARRNVHPAKAKVPHVSTFIERAKQIEQIHGQILP